jgi:hypothetical protein
MRKAAKKRELTRDRTGDTYISVTTEIYETWKEPLMNVVINSYAAYLAISIAVTIWVARTLHKNGRVFLVDAFHGNEPLADSVNHLLVVGFYLVNIGFVSLALKFGIRPTEAPEAIEMLSRKLGWVLLILGAMHFFNLAVFATLRNRATLPPVIRGSSLTSPVL